MLPVTPTFVGGGAVFTSRVSAINRALPDIFRRVSAVGLERSFRGLRGLVFTESVIGGSAVRYDRSTDTIHVHPALFCSGSRVDREVYRGIGLRMSVLHLTASQRLAWHRKAVSATPAVMDRLEAALDGRTRYGDVLAKFRDATERLQVIHVINALVANSVGYQAAGGLDLAEYPPVADFVSGRRPFSLVPLASAYRGGSVDAFEDAFAEYCMNNGCISCGERSVGDALKELFESIAK